MTKEELEALVARLTAQELQMVHQLGEVRGALGLARDFLVKQSIPPDEAASKESQ